MARPSKTRALAIWMNGERVGTWTIHPGAPDEFEYAPEWLASDRARPISLSLPFGPAKYKGGVAATYFDNLLPDSTRLRERLQRRFGASSTNAFDLLKEVGRDCVGAIQLLPVDAPAPNVRKIEATPMTSRQVEHFLTDMLGTAPGQDDQSRDFRISLAGVQEKTALLYHNRRWMLPRGTTPSTHILKLPIGANDSGIDLTSSVENEWLCAEILRAFAVPVATCWITAFGNRKALAVERFDRSASADGSWIMRLPQEDFCQATGTPADRKYESDGGPGIRRIMDLLLGSARAHEDRLDFFKTQMLFWMLCAIDGHAKNFSLFIAESGAYRLTPRYDVLSAFPVLGTSRGKLSPKKVKMSMAVEAINRHYVWHTILPRHWEETARRCGIAGTYPLLREELLDSTPRVIDAVESQLPSSFPEAVSAAIFRGLRESHAKLAKRAAHAAR